MQASCNPHSAETTHSGLQCGGEPIIFGWHAHTAAPFDTRHTEFNPPVSNRMKILLYIFLTDVDFNIYFYFFGVNFRTWRWIAEVCWYTYSWQWAACNERITGMSLRANTAWNMI